MMVNLVYRVRKLVNLAHQYSGRMEPLCLAYAIVNLFPSPMLVVVNLAHLEGKGLSTSNQLRT